MAKLQFNNSITTGHVLQLCVMLFSVITAYFTLEKRVTICEHDVIRLESQHDDDIEGLESTLKRMDEKLDRLIEREMLP